MEVQLGKIQRAGQRARNTENILEQDVLSACCPNSSCLPGVLFSGLERPACLLARSPSLWAFWVEKGFNTRLRDSWKQTRELTLQQILHTKKKGKFPLRKAEWPKGVEQGWESRAGPFTGVCSCLSLLSALWQPQEQWPVQKAARQSGIAVRAQAWSRLWRLQRPCLGQVAPCLWTSVCPSVKEK